MGKSRAHNHPRKTKTQSPNGRQLFPWEGKAHRLIKVVIQPVISTLDESGRLEPEIAAPPAAICEAKIPDDLWKILVSDYAVKRPE